MITWPLLQRTLTSQALWCGREWSKTILPCENRYQHDQCHLFMHVVNPLTICPTHVFVNPAPCVHNDKHWLLSNVSYIPTKQEQGHHVNWEICIELQSDRWSSGLSVWKAWQIKQKVAIGWWCNAVVAGYSWLCVHWHGLPKMLQCMFVDSPCVVWYVRSVVLCCCKSVWGFSTHNSLHEFLWCWLGFLLLHLPEWRALMMSHWIFFDWRFTALLKGRWSRT